MRSREGEKDCNAWRPNFVWDPRAEPIALSSRAAFRQGRLARGTPAPQLSFPSHPAGRWGAGRRAHLSFLQASGDLHHSNQRYPFRMTPTETTTSLSPGTSPSKRKPRLLGSAGSPPYASSRPTPRSTQEPISNSGVWSKLPIQGPDPATPAFGELLPGAAPGQKRGAGSLTRAAKAAREPRHSARQGRPAGAQRGLSAQSAAGCQPGGTGSRRGASGSGQGRAVQRKREQVAEPLRAQCSESRSKLRTRTHTRWFACHLHSALGMDLRSFGHTHLPSSRGREPRIRSGTGRGTPVQLAVSSPRPNSFSHTGLQCVFPWKTTRYTEDHTLEKLC